MTAPPEDLGVRDDTEQHRFLLVQDGAMAQLVYDDREPARLVLIHTEVPEALGGQGIGGRLVRAAAARAAAEGRTIVPWCPFARRWLREHPDDTGGLDIDWASRPPAA